MALNTLIIITGYGSITPKPWKKAYLNINVEKAHQRFLEVHPNARDVSAVSIGFDDEFTLNAQGEISST